jgi:hypothetical protein
MCPVCISSIALAVAGAASIGAVSTFTTLSLARLARPGETHQSPVKERGSHEHKPR